MYGMKLKFGIVVDYKAIVIACGDITLYSRYLVRSLQTRKRFPRESLDQLEDVISQGVFPVLSKSRTGLQNNKLYCVWTDGSDIKLGGAKIFQEKI